MRPVHYSDKIALAANQKTKEKEYWKSKLSGEYVKSDFPYDIVSDEERTGIEKIGELQFQCSEDLRNKLEKLSSGMDIKLHMILLAGLETLLYKYTGKLDIVTGTTIVKQQSQAQLINTFLAYRDRLSTDMSSKEILNQVKDTIIIAAKNQNYPLMFLAQRLNLPGNPGGNPLFDVALLLENIHEVNYLEGMPVHILFFFTKKSNAINLHVRYQKDLYFQHTINRIVSHFFTVLSSLTGASGLLLQDLEILSKEEKRQLIEDFNCTKVEFLHKKTVIELFIEQVNETPGNIAAIGPLLNPNEGDSNVSTLPYAGQITYRELLNNAGQLAGIVRRIGGERETIVSIMLNRSLEMITAILGILISGNAYLPIDPDYPQERQHYMLKESGAKVLIVDAELWEKQDRLLVTNSTNEISIIPYQREMNTGNRGEFGPEKNSQYVNYLSSPNNLAYIIYTSGSTGKPKGVMVAHRNIIAYLSAFFNEFTISSTDIVLQQASFSFDVFVEEVYPILVTGGKLAIAERAIILEIQMLLDFILRNQVTIISVSPLLLNELNKNQTPTSIHTYISGGDSLDFNYVSYLLKRGNVYNTYGPTESTVCATYYRFQEQTALKKKVVPIGKPIANYRVFILDTFLCLLPIGVPGELCVSGPGVSRGYLNRPELTRAKFVSPYIYIKKGGTVTGEQLGQSPIQSVIHTPLYKTGDLARWLPDGNILFLGRLDNQVKVRGYRIELGEIENRLKQYPDVDEAVVIQRMSLNGDTYLCGYILSDKPIEPATLREFLGQKLPDYMVPWFYIPLSHIPLTANGKIDRNALPEPEISREVYVSPRNPIEEKLVELWSDVLETGKNQIGIDTNFFDLGGNSLKAIVMISKLQKELNIKLQMIDIFKLQTIRGIAETVKYAPTEKFISILPAEKKEYYPLSSAQKRLYFIWQMEPRSMGYNIPMVFPLGKDIAKEKIESTLKRLIARHENLRSCFPKVNGTPVQKVMDEVEITIESNVRINETGLKNNRFDVSEKGEEFLRPFDLENAPLIHLMLLRLPDGNTALAVDIHHIISDGTSLSILFKDFSEFYNAGKVKPLRLQYKDFSQWQNRLFAEGKIQEQEIYWTKRFSGEIPRLELPGDFERPGVFTFAGSGYEFTLEGKSVQRFNELSKEIGATLYMKFLSILNILFYKYTGQDDIVIGGIVAGRPHADLQEIIGMFVNTLVMRNYIHGDMHYDSFLQEVVTTSLNAFENQDVPFEWLLEQIEIDRDPSRNPLIDVAMVVQNAGNSKNGTVNDNKRVSALPRTIESDIKDRFKTTTSKFDLTFMLHELTGGIHVGVEYYSAFFKEETIHRLEKHINQLIGIISLNPKTRLKDLEIIFPEEKKEILFQFNNTAAPYPRNKTLAQLFIENVEQTPDTIALVSNCENYPNLSNKNHLPVISSLSYRELDVQSNLLAIELQKRGIQPDSVIILMLERGLDMVIGLLGILKAGGGYVPIDPDYPAERIQYIMADTKAPIIIGTGSPVGTEQCPVLKFNITQTDHYNKWESGKGIPGNSTKTGEIGSLTIAYILYTSGTTGRPKGVMVNQMSVVRLVKGTGYVSVVRGDCILQTGALDFDASTFEIWGALLNGLTLCLTPKEEIISTYHLSENIRKFRISVLWLTASLFNQKLDEEPGIFTPLRHLLVGGDVLSVNHINRLLHYCPKLIISNGYGPTENTTFSTTCVIDREYNNSIPIGQPIANTVVFIVDQGGNLQPKRIAGEIVVGGDGVARGYLNNPELTAHKFIHPRIITDIFGFFRGAYPPHTTIYRTGDLGRWSNEGNIEFLGRFDSQVKIRGYRIELQEIESLLQSHNSVKEALVVAKTGKNRDKYLCGYIVSENQPDDSQLREFLSGQLPGYMIPSFFVFLEKFPFTSGGKINRLALPDPQLEQGSCFIPPQNHKQRQLVKIWSVVLGIKENVIGIDSNFFQLGGHSLNAMTLSSELHKVMHVKIPLVEIFKCQTIRELSQWIEKAGESRYLGIEPVEKKEYYDLSSAQKRIYFLQQLNLKNITYNMPLVLPLGKDVDKIALERAICRLISHHESLRTSVHMVMDEPVQRIHLFSESEIPHQNLTLDSNQPVAGSSGSESTLQTVVEEAIKGFIQPFDLSKAPLMRSGLIQLPDGNHIWVVDVHHIISDGASHTILSDNFINLYAGREIPLLRLQYKDYSCWQNRSIAKGELISQENYWLRQLSGEIPRLEMPTDYKRPEIFTFAGAGHSFKLDSEEVQAFKELGNKNNATLFMNVLAVLNILFYKYTGQEDIIIGGVIAGRPHADLQQIMGMFVNTLAMRNNPAGEKSYELFLREVAASSLDAYANQDVQFERLVESLRIERNTSRNPLFDITLVVQNFGKSNKIVRESSEEHSPQLLPKRDDEIPELNYKSTTSKFDMTFLVNEREGDIIIDIEYYTAVFSRETIRRLESHFKNVVKAVSSNPLRKLNDIEIITGLEREEVLFTFNDTFCDYPRRKTIPQLFEEQVQQSPDVVALVSNCHTHEPVDGATTNPNVSSLTYRELNNASSGLSCLLQKEGVCTDSIVILMMERGLEMVIGILGILQSGGAYLPVDPKYPEERIEYIEADTEAQLIVRKGSPLETGQCPDRYFDITHTNHYKKWEPGKGVVEYGVKTGGIDFLPIAYILYTSGTTGQPKGVMVNHRNVIRLVKNTNYVDFLPGDRILQTGALDFDASTFEIWGALLNGITLYLTPKEELISTRLLKQNLYKFQITLLWLTAPFFNQLVEEDETIFKGLRHLLVGGDVLSPYHINRLMQFHPEIIITNGYGPTENTTFSTTHRIDQAYSDAIPIGKPINNSVVYILGPGDHFQPRGLPGEIVVGGDGVARGYLNNPELTGKRFVQLRLSIEANRLTCGMISPYSPTHPLTHSPVYRTGDRGRWLSSGVIEFLGRIDTQVKIRGYRIEPEEIEQCLFRHEEIKDAVVLPKHDADGAKYLCAYIVPETVSVETVKDFLSLHLPAYMVPGRIVPLEKFPLTSGNKIDRRALLLLGDVHHETESIALAPHTNLEKTIASAWMKVLHLENIGLRDNFFDIGGNSINLLKVHSKLEKALNREIPVVKLFEYTTIRSLAIYLGQPDEIEEEKTVQSIPGGAKTRDNAIAVIGMAGIFPGAQNVHEFWDNLVNGVESIAFFSEEELGKVGIQPQLLEDPAYVKAKGMIDGVEYFDAVFFDYTPREAMAMDPQIRLFHHCVWHALEDGGYDSFEYSGRIGLFAGSTSNFYWEALTLFSGAAGSGMGIQGGLLRNRDFMCTRISYKLNLKGPSYSVHTACSTSLVAIHLACRGLIDGECEMALAGGVTATPVQTVGYYYQEGMIESPDGHCRAFDAASKGLVGGNGAGVVLLKPYEDAIAQGDHIYAIIKGSATNNDGLRKVGYSAPSVEGQVDVLRAAQLSAQIQPDSITYIETHGTATELGDPVELEALKQVFKNAKKGSCGIGSVKTNVGHLDAASGVTGFIKAVLALNHRLIPPNLHYSEPNPRLRIEETPFFVVNRLMEWPAGETPRRAGVSSIGIGGTNAHVILEEAPLPQLISTEGETSNRRNRLIVYSARTKPALEQMTVNLAAYFNANPGINLDDVAFTLQMGRRRCQLRKMVVCSSAKEAGDILSSSTGTDGSGQKRIYSSICKNEDPPVIFICSGQGSQYIGMGQGLYQTEPLFREEMDRCFAIAETYGYTLKAVLYPNSITNDSLDITTTQLLVFIFEYSLSRVLMQWGIKPFAVMGYSLGEYVAACIAGILTPDDAIRLVAFRGELIQQTPEGAMLSVPLEEAQLEPLLNPDVSIAIVNGPSCVVAGTVPAISEFAEQMKQKRLLCTPVNISRAVHSHIMKPIRNAYAAELKKIQLSKPGLPIISNVSGKWFTESDAREPDYWAEQMCAPVRFSEGITELLKEEHAVFIEVGPGRVLGNMIRQHPHKKKSQQVVNPVRHQPEKSTDDFLLQHALGQLWLQGVTIDWKQYYAGEKRCRMSLPQYPFDAKRYWIEEDILQRIFTDQWNKNPNGTPGEENTINKYQLQEEIPDINEEEHYEAPRNELEQNLAQLWQEFLGFERIGIHANFFHLNGDSLTATQLMNRIKEMYPVEITLQDFFEEPTIAHLAEVIKKLLIQKIKTLTPEERNQLTKKIMGTS